MLSSSVCALDTISCVARKLFSLARSTLSPSAVCWNMKWQPAIVGFNSNKVVAFASLSKMTRESWLLSHVIRSLYLTFHWLRREYTGGRARADYARTVHNDNLEICCVHVCEEIEWQKKRSISRFSHHQIDLTITHFADSLRPKRLSAHIQNEKRPTPSQN